MAQSHIFPAGSRPQLIVSLAKSPFLGPEPRALSYKDPVGPVLVESFVAWTVSGSHNPTHSECPRQVFGREASVLSFVTFQTVVRTWNTI